MKLCYVLATLVFLLVKGKDEVHHLRGKSEEVTNEAAQGEEAGAAGLETEEGATTGAEQKARVCRSWVSCKNGFFGNIRCDGNRYCTRWGSMEKAAEKPAESAAEMDAENEAAQGEEAGAGLETEEGATTGAEQKARVCRSWVSCKNGFFGNIRCDGNRYCTRWGSMEKAAEKPAESAAEMDAENEAAQGEEVGAAGLETEEGATTGAEQKARVCRSWVSCKNGFFGNIRCDGNRYCTRWGSMEKAAEKPAESAAEMDAENEAAQGEEAGAGLETEEGATTGAELKARVCRSWVSCKNGFFGNIRCDGNRYCTRWGSMEKAAEKPAESAAELDAENEAAQGEEAGAGLETEEGATTGAEQKARVCRSWVSCKNGFFGNIRCDGNRYCTRWGSMEKAAEKPAESAAEMDAENEAAQGEEAGAGLETEEGATTGAELKARVCRSWVSCKNGFFGNIRCDGNRYCTRWGSMEKAAEKPAESAAEMDAENEAAQGEEAGAGLETEEGATTGAEQKARVCRSWVSCKNGFFGNIRCDGNRYCTRWGSMEKAAEKPAESAAEMDAENEAAQGEEAGAGLETEEGATTGAEQKARVCRSWVPARTASLATFDATATDTAHAGAQWRRQPKSLQNQPPRWTQRMLLKEKKLELVSRLKRVPPQAQNRRPESAGVGCPARTASLATFDATATDTAHAGAQWRRQPKSLQNQPPRWTQRMKLLKEKKLELVLRLKRVPPQAQNRRPESAGVGCPARTASLATFDATATDTAHAGAESLSSTRRRLFKLHRKCWRSHASGFVLSSRHKSCNFWPTLAVHSR